MDDVAGIAAELDLGQLIGLRPDGRECLGPEHFGEPLRRECTRLGPDVDALEVVAVPRIGLHSGLRRGSRERERRVDVRLILKSHDGRDAAEVREVCGVEVEHRDPVAVDP